MPVTVIQHVLARLRDIGVTDIFGVPGDYAFPVNDAICEFPGVRWVGCCNELNAAYAADGYARVKGIGAINTTYAVGELSTLAGVAGAYAEHVPLFHLVGSPPVPLQSAHAIAHHTLGNGEYNLFQKMSEPLSCALAVITPQNVVFETERLIAAALYPAAAARFRELSDLRSLWEKSCRQAGDGVKHGLIHEHSREWESRRVDHRLHRRLQARARD